jgi:hypothetical protein
MRRRIYLTATLLLTCPGCVTEPSATLVMPVASGLWTVGVTGEQARALEPAAAKAVLLARATLDERARQAGRSQPQYVSFTPSRSGDGWQVEVKYVARWDNGQPVDVPEATVVILIDRHWNVIHFGGK